MLRIISLSVIALVILTACSSGGPAPLSTTDFARPSATLERAPVKSPLINSAQAQAENLAGKFIFAPGDGSIWVQDPIKGSPTPVIKPTPELFADAPNWSPDGKTFVYVHSSLTAQGNSENAIYRANADGTGSEPIAIPANTKTTFNWPHYSWDGKWIYFTASTPVPPNKQESEIQRVPAAGGTPEKVIDNARMSTESRDGSKIAFIRFNFDTFTAGLWIADADGKNERELLADPVFLMISSPSFSPDGTEIMFSASGPNTQPLPGISLRTRECSPALFCLFAAPAYADGLPWDLWTVTPDGSKFSRLTQVGADSPWPAWSRDSKHVAFMDTSGQYLVDLDAKTVATINRNGGHGVFGWWQP